MEWDRPYFAASSGTSCEDAVWRQGVRSECAVAEAGEAATVLWDMSSFYERFDLDILGKRGALLGVHSVIIKVTMRAYKGPRHFSMTGIFLKAVFTK
eukprot:6549209-Karenia_brevis.AAC.1